mmetsp:Transcript_69187/g.129129  ORF Transcript_69187/g.129129 Transcript_69187/m.129129 type:complete len:463 (+) Transcript_69187:486-1874(+)
MVLSLALSAWRVGMLLSWQYLGQAIGTVAAGLLADLYGRRRVLLWTPVGLVMMALACALTSEHTAMSITRCLSGFVSGWGLTASFALLAEVSPKMWRPAFFALYNMSFAVGELFAFSGALIWVPEAGQVELWRNLCWWVALPPLLIAPVVAACLTESAHWLAVDGNVSGASSVLHRMALMNSAPEVLNVLGGSTECPKPRSLGNTHPSMLLPPGPATASSLVTRQKILDHLFWMRRYPIELFIFGLLCGCGSLASFGTSCIWKQILTQLGGQNLYAGHVEELMAIRAAGVPAALVNLMMLSYPTLGYQQNLAGMSIAYVLAFIGMLYFGHWSAALMTACGMISVVASGVLSTTTMTFLCESFPTQVRASSIGLALSLGKVISLVPPVVLAICGGTTLLHVVCCMVMISLAFVMFLPETKGENLEDYVQDFMNECLDDDSLEAFVAFRGNPEHKRSFFDDVLL